MAAYLISDVEITNPEAFREYQTRVSATIELYGGRYVARGGVLRVLEGDYRPTRLILIEFPTVEHAQKWYESPEYREILPLRECNAETHLLAIQEGV